MKVAIAGGGTGGHLYPGIALAQYLRDGGSESFFLCTDRPFDARELAIYGMNFQALAAPRLRPILSPASTLRSTSLTASRSS